MASQAFPGEAVPVGQGQLCEQEAAVSHSLSIFPAAGGGAGKRGTGQAPVTFTTTAHGLLCSFSHLM